MATTGLNWLLNRSDKEEQVVEAPAFSLTKVLAIAAPVVTLVVTVITDLVDDKKLDWSEGQVTALIIAVLGLVMVTGSADLIARAVVTAAERQPVAMVTFPEPVRADLKVGDDGGHVDVRVVGFSCEAPARYLCLKDEVLGWEPVTEVTFGGVR